MDLMGYVRQSGLADENEVVRALSRGTRRGRSPPPHRGGQRGAEVEGAGESRRQRRRGGAGRTSPGRVGGQVREVPRAEGGRRLGGGEVVPGGGGNDVREALGGMTQLDPKFEEYGELARRNWAAVELYHYLKVLFEEQAALVS